MARRKIESLPETEEQDLGLPDDTGAGEVGEVAADPDEAVSCVCLRSCVWRGYRDKGDRIRIRRADLGDPFVKEHFRII